MSCLKTSATRAGSAKRSLLSVLAFGCVTPLLVLLLCLQLPAQERPPIRPPEPAEPPSEPADRPLRSDVDVRAIPGIPLELPVDGPVQFREEESRVERPVRDPQTGERRIVTEIVRRYVPTSGQKSRYIAWRLRQLSGNDEQARERFTKELKSVLASEFQERHDRQAEDIETAQARIKELSELHQRRSELKDEIVERRLNELMGQPDVLSWDADLPVGRNDPRFASSPANANVLPPLHRVPIPDHISPPRDDQQVPATGVSGSGPGTLGVPAAPWPTPNGQPAGMFSAAQGSALSADIFAVARKLLAARMTLASATEGLKRMRVLRERGVITQTELAKETLAIKTAQADVEFAEAELKGIEERLQSESEYGESQLRHAAALVANAQAQLKAGTGTMDAAVKAESALAAAKRFQDMTAVALRHLDKALEMVKQVSAVGEDADAVSGTADADAGSEH